MLPRRTQYYENDHALSVYNITDKALLLENLYARCLYIQSKLITKDLLPYFNYLYNMRQECFNMKY